MVSIMVIADIEWLMAENEKLWKILEEARKYIPAYVRVDQNYEREVA